MEPYDLERKCGLLGNSQRADPGVMSNSATRLGGCSDSHAGSQGSGGARQGRITIVRGLCAGLGVAALGVACAYGLHGAIGVVPMLTAALLLGVLAVNIGVLPAAARPGLRFAASRLMRAGVVLLGLQVAFGDIAALGLRSIVMVVVVLAVTFAGTRWLGRRLGLSGRLSLLVAAGFSICGASAVAAVDGVLGRRADDVTAEREIATAVTLVTLCGSLAIVVMPPAGRGLGLSA